MRYKRPRSAPTLLAGACALLSVLVSSSGPQLDSGITGALAQCGIGDRVEARWTGSYDWRPATISIQSSFQDNGMFWVLWQGENANICIGGRSSFSGSDSANAGHSYGSVAKYCERHAVDLRLPGTETTCAQVLAGNGPDRSGPLESNNEAMVTILIIVGVLAVLGLCWFGKFQIQKMVRENREAEGAEHEFEERKVQYLHKSGLGATFKWDRSMTAANFRDMVTGRRSYVLKLSFRSCLRVK